MLVLDTKKEVFYRLGVQYVRTLESYAIIPEKNNPPADRITWNLRVDGADKQRFAPATDEYKELEAEYQSITNTPLEATNTQPIQKTVSDLYSEFLRDRNPTHHDIGLLSAFSVFLGARLKRLSTQ